MSAPKYMTRRSSSPIFYTVDSIACGFKMDIFFYLVLRLFIHLAFGLYLAFAWTKMTLIAFSWLGADLFVTILYAFILVGSMYLFQHFLLESRSRLKTPSEITFQESFKPLAKAAGFALIGIVFVCVIFRASLTMEFTYWTDVFLVTILALWFLVPLFGYALLFVQNQNRIMNRGIR